MGCATSRYADVDSCVVMDDPFRKSSRYHRTGREDGKACEEREEEEEEEVKESARGECTDVALASGIRLGNVPKQIEGVQIAAGWPSWLTDVAGDAIQGMVPLNANSFEKMEKIGQGTYSSVFRAQNLETGKLVALKKVRFDNFDPESVRFMAREIKMLRKLDHPNIIKLEGLIVSRVSCSLYLVFEYMEHDLSGLSSSSDITFSEQQIKCYMRQLLSGLEHCHLNGVMHRDIKGANLLVNNEGVLKMADFGLARCYTPGKKQSLTSRVVTLWYRPPELLLGSTNYGQSIDLWSVGCVFSEMYTKTPILKGRTEVEQLHKIFRLCGSPPDEYWKNTKLPDSTIFRPLQPYPSTIQEKFQHLPARAISLIETLLSIDPHKRGTASDALASEYFTEAPYACEPSSLPRYQPTKEIDIIFHRETRRKKLDGRGLGAGIVKRPSTNNRASVKTCQPSQAARITVMGALVKKDQPAMDGEGRLFVDIQPIASITTRDEGNCIRLKDITLSGPLQTRQQEGRPFGRSKSRHASRSQRFYTRDLSTVEKVEHNDGITETSLVDLSGLLFSRSRRVDEQQQKNDCRPGRRTWFQLVTSRRQ